jgi:PhoPQ-activated pathogenicity-related protein
MLALLSAVLALQSPDQPLAEYLAKPDLSGKWSMRSEPTANPKHLDLISQTWQGRAWAHDLLYFEPAKPIRKGTAILFITGDGPDDRELKHLQRLSEQSSLPVAVVFDVPNQPIFDKREDALIAHTFEQFIRTGNKEWPLLFPMVKSAVRAMDAVEFTSRSGQNPVTKFIVAGASKRGWTTWLTAASGDLRVIGFAPMVIDTLNMKAQLEHQLKSYGKYSEMIGDYSGAGLTEMLESERGKELLGMIDPYSYLPRIKKPALIINGSNDRYWTVDSLSLYWKNMKMPKSALIVPNAGHNLGDFEMAGTTLAAFARATAGEFKMPSLTMSHKPKDAGWWIDVKSAGRRGRIELWVANSRSRDFRDAVWKPFPTMGLLGDLGEVDSMGFYAPRIGQGYTAFMGMAKYRAAGLEFTLSTPVAVLEP